MSGTCLVEQEKREGGCLERWIDAGEAKVQLLLSAPMILTSMCLYAVTLVSVMFAGHLGDLELAGATLGNSWAAVTGIALMMCPVCLKQDKNLAFGCGHQTCDDCGRDLKVCPVCQSEIASQIKPAGF